MMVRNIFTSFLPFIDNIALDPLNSFIPILRKLPDIYIDQNLYASLFIYYAKVYC